MKLLNELIEMLSDENISLHSCLIKAKILAHKLQDDDFKKWVNYELVGYPNSSDLPHYRTINLVLFGYVTNGYHHYPNHRLPTSHLSKQQIENITKRDMLESINSIEEWSKRDNLSFSVPIEVCSLFSEVFAETYYVQNIVANVGLDGNKSILTQVRSKLLDYCLNILDEIPEDIGLNDKVGEPIKELSQKQFQVIVKDNASLHISHDITQTKTNNTNIESNINQISSIDITNLEEAIKKDKEGQGLNEKSWGKNVQKWYDEMLKKAGTESWDISKATASAILANTISKFAGF